MKKMNDFVIRPVVININTADSVLNAEFVYDISEVLCHIIHVTYMMAFHCLGTLKPISLVHRRYSVLTKWATRAKRQTGLGLRLSLNPYRQGFDFDFYGMPLLARPSRASILRGFYFGRQSCLGTY